MKGWRTMRDNRTIVDEDGVFWSTRNGQKHHPIFPECLEQIDTDGELQADGNKEKCDARPAENQSRDFEGLWEEKAYAPFKRG